MKERVKDHCEYVRVDNSFIVNTDKDAYEAARKRRKIIKATGNNEARLDSLEEDVNKIIDSLEIIKQLLIDKG